MDQVLATLVVDFGRHDSERMISDQSANLWLIRARSRVPGVPMFDREL